MLMSMADIAQEYGPMRRVAHVGAHRGQEVPSYWAAGAKQIDLFEPLDTNVEDLHRLYDGDASVVIHHTALGDTTGEAVIHIASNDGQSSSLLLPKGHLVQYPHITFQTSKMAPLARLDSFSLSEVDFLAIDVQGYELEVLRGGAETLHRTKLVYCEVNRAELYQGCPMVEELDDFLAKYGFARKATDWVGQTWGDALYGR